jgi:hypothetical protein
MTIVPVTSADPDASGIGWFAALGSDDCTQLGVPDAKECGAQHCSVYPPWPEPKEISPGPGARV